MDNGGNPHYVPYYEDYEPDTPYPGLISGKTYDWWERTPYPGQHFIEHYARSTRPVLDLGRLALPYILATGQVGYTGYITAEQVRQKELLELTKQAFRKASNALPPLLGDVDTIWHKKQQRRSVPSRPQYIRKSGMPRRRERPDNVGEPGHPEPPPFAPPSPESTIVEEQVEVVPDIIIHQPPTTEDLPPVKERSLRMDIRLPQEGYKVPTNVDPVFKARMDQGALTAIWQLTQEDKDRESVKRSLLKTGAPQQLIDQLSEDGMIRTMKSMSQNPNDRYIPKPLADAFLTHGQVVKMGYQRLEALAHPTVKRSPLNPRGHRKK